MTTRGFACIGLDNVKFDGNVGGALRAAACYGARFVAISGTRVVSKRGRVERTDPRTSHRHMPLIWTDSIMAACPHESVPVAVELVKSATPLPYFVHPESAFYVFGREDGSLDRDTLSKCHQVVFVPTDGCMNLAATVNVILYDRLMKGMR